MSECILACGFSSRWVVFLRYQVPTPGPTEHNCHCEDLLTAWPELGAQLILLRAWILHLWITKFKRCHNCENHWLSHLAWLNASSVGASRGAFSGHGPCHPLKCGEKDLTLFWAPAVSEAPSMLFSPSLLCPPASSSLALPAASQGPLAAPPSSPCCPLTSSSPPTWTPSLSPLPANHLLICQETAQRLPPL